MNTLPERDWKILRAMKGNVLNISCGRIFEKIRNIIEEQPEDEHKAYLKLWEMLERENREVSIMFDDLRRSNSLYKLAAWKRNGVISDDSFAKFTNETQQIVLAFNKQLN